MAKKNKKVPAQLTQPETALVNEQRTASVRHIATSGPVPVEPIASNVQLTPIVQPVAFVPYSSQKQPLFMFDGEEEVEIEEEVVDYIEEESAAPQAVKPKKVVSGVSIFLMITSLLIVAALVVGKFVSAVADYTLITNKVGYTLAEDLFASIKAGDILVVENVVPAAVVLAGVFAVITFLAALFDIRRRGASVFAKVTIFFTLLFAAVVVAMAFVSSLDKGYGLYILAGLAVVQTLVAFSARREKRG